MDNGRVCARPSDAVDACVFLLMDLARGCGHRSWSRLPVQHGLVMPRDVSLDEFLQLHCRAFRCHWRADDAQFLASPVIPRVVVIMLEETNRGVIGMPDVEMPAKAIGVGHEVDKKRGGGAGEGSGGLEVDKKRGRRHSAARPLHAFIVLLPLVVVKILIAFGFGIIRAFKAIILLITLEIILGTPSPAHRALQVIPRVFKEITHSVLSPRDILRVTWPIR